MVVRAALHYASTSCGVPNRYRRHPFISPPLDATRNGIDDSLKFRSRGHMLAPVGFSHHYLNGIFPTNCCWANPRRPESEILPYLFNNTPIA